MDDASEIRGTRVKSKRHDGGEMEHKDRAVKDRRLKARSEDVRGKENFQETKGS